MRVHQWSRLGMDNSWESNEMGIPEISLESVREFTSISIRKELIKLFIQFTHHKTKLIIMSKI